ncbi:hypothetical protein [Fibrivirga algicola]|uniref:Uncharacterized protein n=1 Tax=Fibrivirga algicola TaxID=2950420 RepID=A0ABX0QU67_9BACT|nr:hypothetical protein [Fibrivirga algicola]NID13754.1 hypothetical protein [Fibrivirga algicola]
MDAPKTATFLHELGPSEGWLSTNRVKLYRLDPPCPVRTLAEPIIGAGSPLTQYVAVSSTAYSSRSGKPETIVFLTNSAGKTKLSDLLTQASVQAFDAFEQALAMLGYTLSPINS